MKELNLKDILENTSDFSKEKKVGYVAIIGRPNAGKSTFINSLIGEKISITTNVPQTTRRRVLAIFNDIDSQIIFYDTPGIHKSAKDFNKKINDVATNSFKDSELILYFIDSSRDGGEEEEYIKSLLELVNKPIIRVYTKVDLESRINIPENNNIVKISSLAKIGFEDLLNKVKKHLIIGPLLFSEDYYTKQDIYFRISEIIREKAFLHTKEELPHSIYIKVEEIEETDELLKIVAYIYTETESQKYIIVGKGGTMITQIGKEARIELEKIFDKKVFLALRAKSHKNWRKNEGLIKQILN